MIASTTFSALRGRESRVSRGSDDSDTKWTSGGERYRCCPRLSVAYDPGWVPAGLDERGARRPVDDRRRDGRGVGVGAGLAGLPVLLLAREGLVPRREAVRGVVAEARAPAVVHHPTREVVAGCEDHHEVAIDVLARHLPRRRATRLDRLAGDRRGPEGGAPRVVAADGGLTAQLVAVAAAVEGDGVEVPARGAPREEHVDVGDQPRAADRRERLPADALDDGRRPDQRASDDRGTLEHGPSGQSAARLVAGS